MTRLSRYLLGQLLLPTLIGLLLFTFVMLMNELFFVAQKAVAHGLGWGASGRLILYELPRLVVMTIPMGTLLGTLVAVGRLSADHEWVGMQSAGLGPFALLRPVFIHGSLAALAALVVYMVVFPQASFASRSLQKEIMFKAHLGADLRPRVFYTEADLPGTVLYVDEIRPGTRGQLDGVLIHRSEAVSGFDELILARDGDIYPSADGSGSLEMDLRTGVVHAYRSSAPETYRVFRFGSYHVRIAPPPAFRAFRESPTNKSFLDMGFAELLSELRDARAEPVEELREHRMRRALQEINQRFALPSATLLFSILAVPLGIMRVRSGKGAGFALAIIVIAVYWVVFTSTRDLGVQGHLPVAVGVWAADAVIVAWILVALWRLRHSSGRVPPLRRLAMPLLDAAGRGMERVLAARRATNGETRAVHLASPSRLVGLVDRYVALNYLRILGLSLASIYVVYAIVELKDLLDGAIANRQPLAMILTYFKYLTPGMFNLVLPISCLIGAVVAFTLMARSGELTAVLSSGISLRRAIVPVLLITGALCIVYYLVQDSIAPVTNQKAQQVKDQILGRAPRTYGVSPGGRWTIGSEGRLYHYQLYDPEKRMFQGLSVFTVDRDSPAILDHRFMVATTWDGQQWIVAGGGWDRKFGSSGSDETFRIIERGEAVTMDPPENFALKERTLTARGEYTEQVSLHDLRHQIEELRQSGYDTTRLEVDFQARIAHALNPLVIVILGLPFAFRIGRRGSMYGIGVALLVVIVFWALLAVFLALGQQSLLPPILAAWGPGVVFSLLGSYLILHIRT
jgi:LPS export ABC transporter permease LptG/LPS export ABC transporter permease LptF